jgi:nucleoside-diphosphate-sugar epimerase
MKKLSGRRIVLIGGAGFIGHHLALKLKSLGANVLVIDSLAVNNYYSFRNKTDFIPNAEIYLRIIEQRLNLLKRKKIPLVELDAREYLKLGEVLEKYQADTFVHLAAVAHAGKSNKDPYSTFDHSFRTLENALDIARSSRSPKRHFIFFSSSMVYGNFSNGYVNEDTPCNPMGIYGALKYGGEKLVVAYNQVFDLPYTIIRPSALYGPRCVSRRVGQIFIENAIQGLEVSINGDGSDRLDFTYIDDLIQGVVKVMAHETAKNQILNITYGESRSIAQMADILAAYFPEVKINYLPKDRLMPSRGTLSVVKAQELINYQPQFPLERGFVEYIKWYKAVMPGSVWRFPSMHFEPLSVVLPQPEPLRQAS